MSLKSLKKNVAEDIGNKAKHKDPFLLYEIQLKHFVKDLQKLNLSTLASLQKVICK